MYVSIPSIQQACVLNTCNSLYCTTLNNINYLLDKVLLTLWSFASILKNLFNRILYSSYRQFNEFLFKAQHCSFIAWFTYRNITTCKGYS